MTQYRNHLPQLDEEMFIADGGIETSLIFDEGLDLPDFAAFPLLSSTTGTEALLRYFETYVGLAAEHGLGLVLETPTWRASPDWAARRGHTIEELVEANRRAVELVAQAAARSPSDLPIVISGCVGPRGDGYDPGQVMAVGEARSYHSIQINALASAGADMIGAITMTSTPEAIGIVLAAGTAGMPVAVSFTVETDGRLPTGQPLGDAILAVDEATDCSASYFMVNCAHPTHFRSVLDPVAPWATRLRGVRANASTLSHAELDEAEELDRGDPDQLARQYLELRSLIPTLTVFGGCCGTNEVHINAIGCAIASA